MLDEVPGASSVPILSVDDEKETNACSNGRDGSMPDDTDATRWIHYKDKDLNSLLGIDDKDTPSVEESPPPLWYAMMTQKEKLRIGSYIPIGSNDETHDLLTDEQIVFNSLDDQIGDAQVTPSKLDSSPSWLVVQNVNAEIKDGWKGHLSKLWNISLQQF